MVLGGGESRVEKMLEKVEHRSKKGSNSSLQQSITGNIIIGMV